MPETPPPKTDKVPENKIPEKKDSSPDAQQKEIDKVVNSVFGTIQRIIDAKEVGLHGGIDQLFAQAKILTNKLLAEKGIKLSADQQEALDRMWDGIKGEAATGSKIDKVKYSKLPENIDIADVIKNLPSKFEASMGPVSDEGTIKMLVKNDVLNKVVDATYKALNLPPGQIRKIPNNILPKLEIERDGINVKKITATVELSDSDKKNLVTGLLKELKAADKNSQ